MACSRLPDSCTAESRKQKAESRNRREADRHAGPRETAKHLRLHNLRSFASLRGREKFPELCGDRGPPRSRGRSAAVARPGGGSETAEGTGRHVLTGWDEFESAAAA